MSDTKGINANSLAEVPQKLIAYADDVLASLANMSTAIESTATSFICPEADAFRSKVNDDMKTSNNISKNINTNATDLVRVINQYDTLDKEQAASVTNNIDNVNKLAERRVL